MLKHCTPVKWRKGYTLHRRRQRVDRYGEKQNWYDMEHPDAVIEDGDEDGVCWQDVRTWQTSGTLSSGGRVAQQGEEYRGVLQGALFGTLEVELFDRFVIDGRTYELRKIQSWPGHRLLSLQSV